jgi:general secretion pathway protein L
MAKLTQPFVWFSLWLDQVAATATKLIESLATQHTAQLIEEDDGAFSVHASPERDSTRTGPANFTDGKFQGPAELKALLSGQHVELIMQPRRFLFRSLELPGQATEFLEGIIRAQIDRLTPWNAQEAVFGANSTTDAANQRILVAIAATARERLQPFMDAMRQFDVKSVAICTKAPNAPAGAAPVKVFEQKTAALLGQKRVYRMLRTALLALIVLACGAVAASIVVNNNLQARQDELLQRIDKQRDALRAQMGVGKNSALSKLEQRKYEIAPAVIVLESLSKILPDDTYVTELRIDGDKIQIIGITHEAPSLIRLIEQSGQFKHAVFFAPTTRGPSDPGDRFHIEARILPFSASPS